jgi:hypothetical protein
MGELKRRKLLEEIKDKLMEVDRLISSAEDAYSVHVESALYHVDQILADQWY